MEMLSFYSEKVNNFSHDLCDTIMLLWKVISVKFLKPYFGIETTTYKDWRNARAKRRQRELDWQHNTRISELYWKPDHE